MMKRQPLVEIKMKHLNDIQKLKSSRRIERLAYNSVGIGNIHADVRVVCRLQIDLYEEISDFQSRIVVKRL